MQNSAYFVLLVDTNDKIPVLSLYERVCQYWGRDWTAHDDAVYHRRIHFRHRYKAQIVSELSSARGSGAAHVSTARIKLVELAMLRVRLGAGPG
eukprot:4487271-Pleurochrysis_carterae.AAC.2